MLENSGRRMYEFVELGLKAGLYDLVAPSSPRAPDGPGYGAPIVPPFS